jgi:hypothetical protein
VASTPAVNRPNRHGRTTCRAVAVRTRGNPAPVNGQLVRTTRGQWITHPPSQCPNGHPLGPNQVLVGHVACLGHGGGGHTSWHCRTCDAVASSSPTAMSLLDTSR